MLRTPRLALMPATPELARADLRGRTELEQMLRIRVPQSWPPELYDAAAITHAIRRLEEGPEQAGWWFYYLIRSAGSSDPPVLLGVGGYKGPPRADGSVEIGYSVLPAFRRQGYATEAVRGLVAHAFAHEQVTRIFAETLPSLVASIGVLEKSGFSFIGPGSAAGVIRYRLTRARYEMERVQARRP